MEINKKRGFEAIFAVIIITFLIGSVSSFAISSMHGKALPLTILPGETKEIKIELQNMAGTEDIYATGGITEGSEIAEIINENETYLVPAGQRIPINIRVSVPTETEPGNYTITLSFTTVPESGAPLGFGINVEKVIPVVILGKGFSISELGKSTWIYLIIGIIILLAIIIIIYNKKKKAKK